VLGLGGCGHCADDIQINAPDKDRIRAHRCGSNLQFLQSRKNQIVDLVLRRHPGRAFKRRGAENVDRQRQGEQSRVAGDDGSP